MACHSQAIGIQRESTEKERKKRIESYNHDNVKKNMHFVLCTSKDEFNQYNLSKSAARNENEKLFEL